MPKWHRTVWMEAVWSCADLKPLEKLVCSVYFDHARDERIAWVSLSRLCERTGLSRDAANRALRGLVDKEWLIQVEASKQHKSTRYALTIPSSSSTGDGHLDVSAVRETDTWGEASSTPHDASSTRDDASSTPRVPDLRSIPDKSHSPRETYLMHTAAEHLGLRPDDALLVHLSAVLEAKNVRDPMKWIPTAARNGSLRKALSQQAGLAHPLWLKAASDGWGMSAPRKPDQRPEGWR